MKTSFTFLAVLLLISSFSFGQDFSKKIDSIVKDNYQKNPDVGISVGFIDNNKEFFTAYGKLSKESKVNIDKNSIFEIASITKILTSNLIAQAVIDHKFKVDDYIDSYLPKRYVLNANLKNKIKISDLASHQSGLPDLDFGKLMELNPQQPVSSVTEESLASMINKCTELVDYGKFRYSTIGYTLMGEILETVYGKSYDEIISEKIIQPLKMRNTFTKEFNVKNKTTGYNPDGGAQEFFKWNVTAPAGLVKSNASDMITYLKAILTQGNPISEAALITEKIYYKDEKREMGLGLGISTDDQNTIYLKSGDSMGQSSIICYNRAKKWGFIILLNQRNSKMRQNLLNTIYDKVLK
ncbi:class A beta-lactamase-related serine hydrolase [Chryseobacterium joostei]|uniref:Class A beta-lactamase-related serine hydrolase n=1 Tax=Chryseobacterium joostei TaxID=112234 RepID=A0A1N7KC12_9FLAO|nr:serine hydrolase domain-containing protein [Chryseobacterium joostei]AZB01770.1 class A beta-lactamase-related serine hydrolase [Chryseobacterium joostei]SIS59093.1 CubicO group peptidase, beta-lactamase class C family [Chryseobacterium joostei]